MLYIIHLLFTDGFPSGQRGQTVNLLAPPSKVRILLHPANLALTSLRCGSYFFCAKRKPQRGRKAAAPLHTPRAFFKEFLVVEEGRVLTCACMLRCWMWDAVPRMVSVCCFTGMRDVVKPICVCFGIGYGTLCRSASCMLQYWMWSAVPIYFLGDTAGYFIGCGRF